MDVKDTQNTPDESPRGPDEGSRGPRQKKLDNRQRLAFLKLVEDGNGPQLTCNVMGITYRVYRNTYERSETFKKDVADAIETSRQKLEKVAHDYATENLDDQLPNALTRIDRARQLSQARQDALASKAAPSADALMEIALKVFRLCKTHISDDKLVELQDQVLIMVQEAASGNRN